MQQKIVDIEGPFLKIKFSCNSTSEFYAVLDKVKSLDGRIFNAQSKLWTAPICKENIEILKDNGFEFTPQAKSITEQDDVKLPERKYKRLTEEQKEVLKDFYPFQIEGIEFLLGNENVLIADEMGLGKSAQALGYLKLNLGLRPVLIICPASLKLNWQKEIKKWGLRNEKVQIISGETPYKLNYADIYIINYDILFWHTEVEVKTNMYGIEKKKKYLKDGWFEILSEMEFKTVIVDECQMISNCKALRTKAFNEIIKGIRKNKILLSGTPFENYPSEFFTALHTINPKIFPNEWQYKNRFCNPKHDGYGWTFKGISNEKELYKLVYPIMIRREKKDVLKDLPPKQKIIIPMELDPVQLKYYEKASEEFREWVKEKQSLITTKEQIEQLKQLAYISKRNSVLQWIKDYISIGNKLIVGAWHIKVLDDLEKEFKNKCVRMDGSTANTKRQHLVDKFQTDEKIKLFIGNLKVLGVGHTLTAANATCTIEFLWGPGKHEQFESRVHRIGQEADSVFAYYLIAPGTVEEDIIDLIQEKAKMLGQVLDGQAKEFIDDNILNDLLKRISKCHGQEGNIY